MSDNSSFVISHICLFRRGSLRTSWMLVILSDACIATGHSLWIAQISLFWIRLLWNNLKLVILGQFIAARLFWNFAIGVFSNQSGDSGSDCKHRGGPVPETSLNVWYFQDHFQDIFKRVPEKKIERIFSGWLSEYLAQPPQLHHSMIEHMLSVWYLFTKANNHVTSALWKCQTVSKLKTTPNEIQPDINFGLTLRARTGS